MSLIKILEGMNPATSAWSTLAIVDASPDKINVKNVDRPYPEPQEARKIRENYFLSESLNATMQKLNCEASLKKSNISYSIEDYKDPKALDNAVNKALFMHLPTGEKKRLNFDGPNTNFNQLVQNADGTFNLGVYPISFSEWMACKNPDFTAAYKKENNGKIPYAGVGISVVLETSDDFFVLTQRGISTPNYPGTLFTVGGGLNFKHQVLEGLLDEMLDEVGKLKKGTDYNPEKLIVTAIGADNHYAGSEHARPEITAYLKLNAPWRRIVELQGKTEFQADVNGIVPLDTNFNNFESRVAILGATAELLPSSEIGLYYAILKKIENEKGPQEARKCAERLNESLNRYTRRSGFDIPQFKKF